MCVVAKGPNHGPAPIPEEGKWIQAKEIKDISGYTHGIARLLFPSLRQQLPKGRPKQPSVKNRNSPFLRQ